MNVVELTLVLTALWSGVVVSRWSGRWMGVVGYVAGFLIGVAVLPGLLFVVGRLTASDEDDRR